jgi:diguanylate cyclase (GGDEF)-like protein
VSTTSHEGTLLTGDHDEARVSARASLLDAMIAIQVDPALGRPEVAALVEEGDRRGWDEVSLVGRYIEEFTDRTTGGKPVPERLEEMWRLGAESDDPGLSALALAYRARIRATSEDIGELLVADNELARAVVLLEQGVGGTLERIAAHVECGINFGSRRFWELESQQYQLARAIHPLVDEPAFAPFPRVAVQCTWAPIYNGVELETRWASACCVVGDTDGQRSHAETALGLFAEATTADLPPPWLEDLRRTALLARALAGEAVAAEAAALATLPTPDPMVTAGVLTARAVALAWSDPAGAAEAAEEALRITQGVPDATEIDLLLYVAALVEGSDAGMRFGLFQSRRRWSERQSSLNAMQASLRSERWRTRSEELERHAHLDPLTGLSNRRGFARYLEDLVTGSSEQLAVLAVDVDRFKVVNDTYGHSAGDETLAHLGAILSNLVRPGDLAARLGGDEFVLLLDGAGTGVALERAEAIRHALAGSGHPPDEPRQPTLSVGVASGSPDDLDQLMADADFALYEAKSAGGDRTTVAPRR